MMKRKLFCVFITFVSLFFILCNQAFAVEDVNYEIQTYDIDATIRQDGSMDVTEWIVQKGSFNGYYRDINYKGQVEQEPQGTKQDFYGCTLYNASAISDIEVFDFDTESDLRKVRTAFKQVETAENGDSGVYELSQSENGFKLKMYQESENSTKGYAIRYHLKDVILNHKDVAELNWSFIGTEFVDNIGAVKISVHLPGIDNNAKIWLGGPLESYISLGQTQVNTYALAEMSDLSSGTPMDVRIAFDKSLLTSCAKTTKLEALPLIIEVETERANDANQKREQADAESRNVINTIIAVAVITVLFLVAAYIMHLRAKSAYKVQFKGEYYRELPVDYDIEAVEVLLSGKPDHLTLSATIMELARKEIFLIKPNPTNKKEFTFFLNANKAEELSGSLNTTESFVLVWLTDVGISQGFTNKELEKWCEKNADSFYGKLEAWRTSIKSKYTDKFYESSKARKKRSGIYTLAMILYAGIFLMKQVTKLGEAWIPIIITSLTVILLGYAILGLSIHNPYGHEEAAKMLAFKKFLLDFGRFGEKELPEIILWQSYLSYATVLGIADKVEKAMKIQIEKYYNSNQYSNSFAYMSYASYAHSINNITDSAVSSARASQSSSGSGSGGGGSSGGGSGGF